MSNQGPEPVTAATAAEYFGGMAADYDDLIHRAVPKYEEMRARLVEYLPDHADAILELGCGTGSLSLALAARFPDATCTCIDGAAEMVGITRSRLAAHVPAFARRARFLEQRFEELRLPAASFDLVTSSISLHHVRDKAALYRSIRSLLANGGTFAFADQMLGASDAVQTRHWARWLEFCRRPNGCTEEEIASLLAHAAAHDHYTPLPEHFALLDAAGFGEVDCIWRDGSWAIIRGTAW